MKRHIRICFIMLLAEWCPFNETITLGTILPSLAIYILILDLANCDSYNGGPSFSRLSTLSRFFCLTLLPTPPSQKGQATEIPVSIDSQAAQYLFLIPCRFCVCTCIDERHTHRHTHRLSEIERFERGKGSHFEVPSSNNCSRIKLQRMSHNISLATTMAL